MQIQIRQIRNNAKLANKKATHEKGQTGFGKLSRQNERCQ
jgi:hypothetical protein